MTQDELTGLGYHEAQINRRRVGGFDVTYDYDDPVVSTRCQLDKMAGNQVPGIVRQESLEKEEGRCRQSSTETGNRL
jgi:hypothetical protein